ncbi:transcriptional regulator [Rhodococcus sp. SRB_17]|uniref:TfoX/Sxy family protein n=1 Tax=Acidovorax sp. SRB_24 TaxID=1962700 RepID=UPI00145EB953|nr:TfoX/Sxy family protein [Acidovorax sp. SRB_24]NMM76489.1 transcriptional regulator [Acidovorax sp. SRB_24]NMM90265.1 transcriptional regulator [Rhodococcus sp. SRB_17]
MPARPLADATLHLIDAVRSALARRDDVDERTLFGSYCFFVDGKLCIGVKGDELLVRLPPERHAEFQEMQNTRELSPSGGMQGYFWIEPNGYATRAQWAFWLAEALDYNPRAKATPPRKKAPTASTQKGTGAPPARRKHSIFDADD